MHLGGETLISGWCADGGSRGRARQRALHAGHRPGQRHVHACHPAARRHVTSCAAHCRHVRCPCYRGCSHIQQWREKIGISSRGYLACGQGHVLAENPLAVCQVIYCCTHMPACAPAARYAVPLGYSMQAGCGSHAVSQHQSWVLKIVEQKERKAKTCQRRHPWACSACT